jgi:hypothetical protein
VERRLHRRHAPGARGTSGRSRSGGGVRRSLHEPDSLAPVGPPEADAGGRRVDRGGTRRARACVRRHAWGLGPPGASSPLHPSHGDVAVARARIESW